MQSAFIDPLLSAFESASKVASSSYSNTTHPRKRQRLEKAAPAAEESFSELETPEEEEDAPLPDMTAHSTENGSKSTPSPPSKVYRALVKGLFDVASKDTTKDSNRRKLYIVCKTARENLAEEEEA